jgi:hypothetical protein
VAIAAGPEGRELAANIDPPDRLQIAEIDLPRTIDGDAPHRMSTHARGHAKKRRDAKDPHHDVEPAIHKTNALDDSPVQVNG